MKEVKSEHYIDTIIYSIDKVLRIVKSELMHQIETELEIGITSEQFVVLDTISCFEDIYPQKLSEIMMKDKSNTKRILQVLEEKDLIERKVGNANHRLVYKLAVTDKGKALLKTSIPRIKKCITDLFENISDDEIELLHNLSKKFQAELSKHEKRYNNTDTWYVLDSMTA